MVATVPEISLGLTLTDKQAREIFAQGERVIVFVLLQFAQQLASQSAAARTSHETPATPSGMKPPYAKPTASQRGTKKPRRKKGHPGNRRSPLAARTN